jgi:hypothetical protein
MLFLAETLGRETTELMLQGPLTLFPPYRGIS